MMNKIVYKLVFNRKKCLNKSGQGLVQIEAYLHGKRKYFSTHVYLLPTQWDTNRSQVRHHPNADWLNQRLYDFKAELERMELSLWKQGKTISLNLLKTHLCQGGTSDDFLAFYRQEVVLSALKESSKKNHLTTWNLLRTFRKNLSFSELTYHFLTEFEHFLYARKHHTNTVAKHMKHLKRYVNAAISKDYLSLQQNPFRHYKVKTIASSHTFLTPGELDRLESCSRDELSEKRRKIVDAFLFCCYVGLRYSDFIRLTEANFVEISGNRWLIYQTLKTGIEVRVPLYLLFDGKALAILNRYKGQWDGFFQLKDNSNVNKILKSTAVRFGIDKRISFHTARHTNATLLIYEGVSITTVQKLLGHQSVKTTQIYADVTNETLVKDLKKCFGETSKDVGETSGSVGETSGNCVPR